MVVRKKLYSLISFFLTSFSASYSLWAGDFKPWIGDQYEFEWTNELLYQTYSEVAKQSSLKHHSSNDLFLETRLSNALKSDFSLEAEAVVAMTKKQRPNLDHLSISGRYVWLDDVAGDPITLTTGMTLIRAFSKALDDISSFHHGLSEYEIFLSLGKETAILGDHWTHRCWGCLGFGSAVLRGAPWLRGQCAYEVRLRDIHEWRVFGHVLFGLGSKTIQINDFHGYGSIQHQSVDIGLRYTYLIKYFGNFSVEYSYRPYARNFPAQTHRVLFSLFYSFGL